MRIRILAAVAAVLVFAGLAPAQRFDAYTTSVGGQAGQWVPGNTLFYPAVKVGGEVTVLPTNVMLGGQTTQAEADGNYGFAYCLSSTANTAGGYIYLPNGARLAAVWVFIPDRFVLDEDDVPVFEPAHWSLHRTADFTTRGYFFSFPYAAYNDGTVMMMGYTYTGRVEYFVW